MWIKCNCSSKWSVIDPVTLTFEPQNSTTSMVPLGHSLHQVWTLCDHSFLSYAADKQMYWKIYPRRPTESAWVITYWTAIAYIILTVSARHYMTFVLCWGNSAGTLTCDHCFSCVSCTTMSELISVYSLITIFYYVYILHCFICDSVTLTMCFASLGFFWLLKLVFKTQNLFLQALNW